MPRIDFSIPRLIRAWRDARVADAYPRERRREITRAYAGPHWGEQALDVDQPLNLVSLYVDTFSAYLVPKTPRFMLSTFERSQRAAVDALQEWGNRELKRMNFGVTCRRIVIDALFGVGIGRVALATPQEAANRGWGPKGGEPIVTRIDREDFAYDSFAGDFLECAWQAHRYRSPLAAVTENKAFNRTRKQLQATRQSPYDEYGVERVGVLGRGFYGQEEAEDTVELWEFYLPRHRRIITLMTDGAGTPVLCGDNQPLGDQPWIGPDNGPYHHLGYKWIPGNAMPGGPLQDLFDPAEAANQFYRKAIGSTERTKTITLFRNEEDAKRIQGASDGDTQYCEDPQSVQNVTYGGEHVQAVYGIAQAMRELFDFMGGNLALLGGRGQQAKTLGQEQLLQQNAQGGVGDKQEATIRYVDDLIGENGLLWYWWRHPFQVQKAPLTVTGLPGVSAMRHVFPAPRNGEPPAGPLHRSGDMPECEVDAYSLMPQNPAQRLAMLRQVWQQEVIPVLPLLAQQGVQADFNAYLSLVGKYQNNPDYETVLTIREPVDAGGSTGGQGQTPMPGNTSRTYNRVSGSDKTQGGQMTSQINNLLSGKDEGGAKEPETAGMAT